MFVSLSLLEAAITKVLSQYYPITSQKILQKIEINSSSHYSTAGLHRALKALRDKGMVHKHGKFYQLRTDRLIDEKKEIQAVLDRYIEAQNYHIFQKQEVHYYITTLSELDYLWNSVVEQWFNFYPPKAYSYWQRQPVPWFPLVHSDEERRIVKRISTHCNDFRTYAVNAPISRQVQPIYSEEKNSSLHFTKSTRSVEHAYSVYGDHIIETKHPAHIKTVLEELARGTSESIPFHSIIELSVSGSYEVIITKNPKKAERYRQKLLSEEDGKG